MQEITQLVKDFKELERKARVYLELHREYCNGLNDVYVPKKAFIITLTDADDRYLNVQIMYDVYWSTICETGGGYGSEESETVYKSGTSTNYKYFILPITAVLQTKEQIIVNLEKLKEADILEKKRKAKAEEIAKLNKRLKELENDV